MSAREFLRGGYRNLTDVTVVSNHGRPIFTVFPYNRDTSVMTVELDREGSATFNSAEPRKK